jgi:ATP-dependent helicase YprA (DUF1998 family)
MKNEKKIKGEKSEKLLPSDFYIEGTRKVMTESYHIKRGYCCGSGCRHCPYEPKGQNGNTTLSKKSQ